MKVLLWAWLMLSCSVVTAESTCYGTTANGRLEGAVKLPAKGKNFVGYSSVASLVGRTYVHSSVWEIVIDSYSALSVSEPRKYFKYAETGYKEGGVFKPHKTHQNGLSIDFMVPVIDSTGTSVHLPTNLLNKLGYSIEFDKNSRFEGYRIDYDAMAAHIVALDRAAKSNGHGLWRVIFAPELQAHLLMTASGKYLKDNVQFSKKRSWVRHDEHYHVDFDIPCLDM